jgi:hypothetical protein
MTIEGLLLAICNQVANDYRGTIVGNLQSGGSALFWRTVSVNSRSTIKILFKILEFRTLRFVLAYSSNDMVAITAVAVTWREDACPLGREDIILKKKISASLEIEPLFFGHSAGGLITYRVSYQ